MTTPLGQRFGQNLRDAREAFGISQEELALRCGIHPTHISKIERGGSVPGVEVMIKVVGALAIEPNMICAGIRFDPGSGRIEIDPEAGT